MAVLAVRGGWGARLGGWWCGNRRVPHQRRLPVSLEALEERSLPSVGSFELHHQPQMVSRGVGPVANRQFSP